MSQPSELFPMIESDAVEPDENQTPSTSDKPVHAANHNEGEGDTSHDAELAESTIDSTTDSADEAEDTEADGWDATMTQLRSAYPKASDGILFCVYKLQQNDQLTIVDFRDEARLYGISLGGRALHSAKVLLGLEQPSKRRTKAELGGTPTAKRPVPRATPAPAPMQARTSGVEDTLIRAVQQIQDAATVESQKLRTAIKEAMAILQEALDS